MTTEKTTKKSKSVRSGEANVGKIADALRSLGAGWYGRAEIAEKLGQRVLNFSDVGALKLLIEAGQVEVRRSARRTELLQRWEYRLIVGQSGADM